jgi:hypothetical protein
VEGARPPRGAANQRVVPRRLKPRLSRGIARRKAQCPLSMSAPADVEMVREGVHWRRGSLRGG